MRISVFRGEGKVCRFVFISMIFFLPVLSTPSYAQQGQIINVVASSEPVENASLGIKANVKSLSTEFRQFFFIATTFPLIFSK